MKRKDRIERFIYNDESIKGLKLVSKGENVSKDKK